MPSNEPLRRFHNRGEGFYYRAFSWYKVLSHLRHYTKTLIDVFNQEKALVTRSEIYSKVRLKLYSVPHTMTRPRVWILGRKLRGDPPEVPVTARPCVGLCYLMRLRGIGEL